MLAGVGTLRLTVGASQLVKITGDDNLVPLIETTVEDGRLYIKPRQPILPDVPLEYEVRVPALRSASLVGATSGEIVGVRGPEFELAVIGSGSATASGSTEALKVRIEGAGDVRATELTAGAVDVSIAGTGDVHVHATEKLSVSIAGAGGVHYRGNPQVTQDVAGVGSVQRIE